MLAQLVERLAPVQQVVSSNPAHVLIGRVAKRSNAVCSSQTPSWFAGSNPASVLDRNVAKLYLTRVAQLGERVNLIRLWTEFKSSYSRKTI